MRSKAVCAFRVSSSFYASLDRARLRIPFTLQKHNTWITIMEQGNNDFLPCCFYQNQRSSRTSTRGRREKAGNTHTLLPATLFPCPAWLHSKSFQFVKESLQRDMHQNHFFVWGRFLLARKRYFNLLVWWESERERGGGWHLLHSHPKHMQKIILHLFPISLLYYSHRTSWGCVWTSQHPLLPIWPPFSGFLCTLIRSQAQGQKGWT